MASATNSRNNGGGGGGNNNGTHRICRYFLTGQCRDGTRCRYSHDRNSDRSTMNLCKYFLRGQCSYGESCKYEHVRPVQRSSTGSAEAGDSCRGASSSSTDTKSKSMADNLADVLSKTKLRADAKEFIPSWKNASENGLSAELSADASSMPDTKEILCPYHILGQCWYGDQCSFLHGIICDLCDRPVLHPDDAEINRKHRQECLAEHERDMKDAFAVARTKEKQCGICMEIVLEKANLSARRFGILPSCKHCFCLDCIRKWRQAKTFETKIIRACPECRTVSDFVAPSTVWVEEEDEKRALIEAYQSAMKEKVCKYFRDGKMECPFGNRCFYRHVKPDGTVVKGDSPRTIRRRQRQRQRRQGGGNEGGQRAGAASADLYLLWEFLDETDWRRNRLSPDDWPWEFQVDDDLDWLSLTDSESDYYDY